MHVVVENVRNRVVVTLLDKGRYEVCVSCFRGWQRCLLNACVWNADIRFVYGEFFEQR